MTATTTASTPVPRRPARAWRLLIAHTGSPRTTLALLALLGGLVLLRPGGWPLAVPLAALAANLLAALWRHPALRRQVPLLVAHLALLALLLGAGAGRLLALDGRFELTEGVPFDGRLLDAASGDRHHGALAALQLRHGGFEIDYAPGRRRGATRNSMAWVDAGGVPRQAVIGDHRPLLVQGFRIYTSPNKGFAPLLRWQPDQGEPVRGAVHLPSFPVHALQQSREWPLPDGRSAWVQLHTDETLIDPARASRFSLPREHRLVLRVDALRAELAPGDAVALPGGTLVYEGLRTWMGYRIAHDPTLPWLLAAALLCPLALALHYVLKFRRSALPPVADLGAGLGADLGAGHG